MKTCSYWVARGAALSLAAVVALPVVVVSTNSAVAAGAREEITVTARRRSESIQDVPLAVTAIGADAIANRGIKDLAGIVALDPSIVVDQGFSAEDTRIAVRGLSNTKGKSNVAFLVDGVDVTSESTLSAGSSLLVNQRLLGDVERIEVIKGPQSALYGRSAFAGALSYITKNANLEAIEGSFGLEVSEYNRHQVSGSISGPLIENKLGVRFQAVEWDGDSYYDNAASGRNLGGADGFGTSFTLNFEPNERTDIKWRVAYSDEKVGAQPQFIFAPEERVELPIPSQAFQANGGPLADGTQVFSVPSFGSANGRQIFASENPYTGGENIGADSQILNSSLQINHDIGPGTFSSITGFTDADFTIGQDVDYQGRGFPDEIRSNFQADSLNDTRQFTQELRYATDLDGAFNYTVGLLGWMEDRDALDRSFIATCRFNNNAICDNGGWQELVRLNDLQYGDNGYTYTSTRHWSLYGLVEWDATDRLTLSAEARWVNEHFEVARTTGSLCLLTPFILGCTAADKPGVAVAGSERSNYITPKVLAEFALTDDTMIYASVASGQKPGGISTLSSGGSQIIKSLRFDSEKLWAYEAGWKTSFDGSYGQLTFNGAIFFQDYTDKQVLVNIFDPVFGIIPAAENASSAQVFGQELQLVYLPPIDGLTINLGYTHLDTEFSDFVSEVTSAREIAENNQCTVAISSTGSGRTICIIDRSGNKLEVSPENTFTSTFSYTKPLFDTGLDVLAEFDANFTDERFVDSSNYSMLESHWLANLRLGISNDAWSAVAFADNLFDDDTIKSTGAAAPDFGEGFAIPPVIVNSTQLPTPRVVGVRLNFYFGG